MLKLDNCQDFTTTTTERSKMKERPTGLEQELLAAIRRKISKQPKLDVDSNSVSSTQQPPFFQPLNPKDRSEGQVKFFVRVPNGKPGRQKKVVVSACS